MSSSNSRKHAEGHEGLGSSSDFQVLDPELFLHWQKQQPQQQPMVPMQSGQGQPGQGQPGQQQQQQPTGPLESGQGHPGQHQPDALMDIDEAFASTDFDPVANEFMDSAPMMENGTIMPYSEDWNATHTSTTYTPGASQVPHGFPQTVQSGLSSTTPVLVNIRGLGSAMAVPNPMLGNAGPSTVQRTFQQTFQQNLDPTLGAVASQSQPAGNAPKTFTITIHPRGCGDPYTVTLSKPPKAEDVMKIHVPDRGNILPKKTLLVTEKYKDLREWYNDVRDVFWKEIILQFSDTIPRGISTEVLQRLRKSHPCINDPWTGHFFYKVMFGAGKKIEKLKVWMYGTKENTILPFNNWRETLRAKTDPKDRCVPDVTKADVIALWVLIKNGDPRGGFEKAGRNKWELLKKCKLLQIEGPLETDEYWAGFEEELKADPNQEGLFTKVTSELGVAAHAGTTAESHDDAETALVRQLKQQIEDKDVRIQQLEYENAELRKQNRKKG
ncbi:hypothetical protein VP1G_06969 [Cytospora mali]|uniref:Uncharacterized protein n=1 Tax=Cytospora mali TaxID=578113 RepID=A0A194V765_CYTMA|nr:hypothetical protein VP1G_06969 [Valsa mali var. pyri (nom. inval.)]